MKKLYYLMFLVFAVACKDGQAIIFKNEELNGTTYLRDPILETSAVPAPKLDIFLYDGETAKNFMQKTTGDDQGKFRFIFQPEQKSRTRIVSEYRDATTLLYRASLNASEFQDSLILTPQYNQALIKIKTLDTNYEPLAGMNVYVFTSASQAAAARTGTPVGAIKTMKSNERAVAAFHGLPPGSYYLIGKKDSLNTTLVDTVTISVTPSTGVYKVTAKKKEITATQPLILSLYDLPVLLTVSVRSNKDQPLAGIAVYMFSSLAQAASVRKEAVNFITEQKTNNLGKAEFRRLPTGTFYLAANGKFIEADSLVVKSVVDSNSVTFPLSTPLNHIPSRNRTLTIKTD